MAETPKTAQEIRIEQGKAQQAFVIALLEDNAAAQSALKAEWQSLKTALQALETRA